MLYSYNLLDHSCMTFANNFVNNLNRLIFVLGAPYLSEEGTIHLTEFEYPNDCLVQIYSSDGDIDNEVFRIVYTGSEIMFYEKGSKR